MATSIRELAAELREIALAATDASGFFPAMYHRETTTVAAELERGGFAEPDTMERLTHAFAARYIRALRDETRPRCWQATWDVAGDRGLLVVQHLLLGINAHVNHDLPLAVVEVVDRGATLAGLATDFAVVNRTLEVTYREVLDDLERVTRWVSEAASVGGGRLFNFSLRRARTQAWDAAQRMIPLDADRRAAYGAELDRLVSVLAYLVTRPPLPVRLLARAARRLEEHDPAVVTAALLGIDRR